MRRLAAALVFATTVFPRVVLADPTPTPAPTILSTPAPTATQQAPQGLAVVALSGATDAAWPLAQAIYADAVLRPAAIDDMRARVLCGESAPDGPGERPGELSDLAESVAAVKGDDAPSRAILGAIAKRMSVKALVVVQASKPQWIARVYFADTGAFDAATYTPDVPAAPTGAQTTGIAWTSAVHSLDRQFGSAAAPEPTAHPAPALASREGPRLENGPPARKLFYESGWFWGALGAAAFAGGAIFLATRDSSASSIHLEMQVPH